MHLKKINIDPEKFPTWEHYPFKMSQAGHAQFIIATHSPILMACPEAAIFSFDQTSLKTIKYEETEHYRIYKDFMKNRDRYVSSTG